MTGAAGERLAAVMISGLRPSVLGTPRAFGVTARRGTVVTSVLEADKPVTVTFDPADLARF